MSFVASRTMSQFVISTSACCAGLGRPPPRPRSLSRPLPRPRPPPPRPRPRPRPFCAPSWWSGDAVVSSRASQHFGQTSKLHGWHLHKVGVVMRIPQISHQLLVVCESSSACACSEGRSAASTRVCDWTRLLRSHASAFMSRVVRPTQTAKACVLYFCESRRWRGGESRRRAVEGTNTH